MKINLVMVNTQRNNNQHLDIRQIYNEFVRTLGKNEWAIQIYGNGLNVYILNRLFH